MPVTICVLIRAVTGQEEMLGQYEDQALRLLGEHKAHVRARVRALEGPITEVQILEFPSEQALANFQNDPRRLALSAVRDSAVASTEVIRVEHVSRG